MPLVSYKKSVWSCETIYFTCIFFLWVYFLLGIRLLPFLFFLSATCKSGWMRACLLTVDFGIDIIAGFPQWALVELIRLFLSGSCMKWTFCECMCGYFCLCESLSISPLLFMLPEVCVLGVCNVQMCKYMSACVLGLLCVCLCAAQCK